MEGAAPIHQRIFKKEARERIAKPKESRPKTIVKSSDYGVVSRKDVQGYALAQGVGSGCEKWAIKPARLERRSWHGGGAGFAHRLEIHQCGGRRESRF